MNLKRLWEKMTDGDTMTLKYMLKNTVYSCKWLLLTFYLGLIFVFALYSIHFGMYIVEMAKSFVTLSEDDMLLAVLKAIDLVMVANLIKTIISGSYYSMVDRTGADDIDKISSGYLKVKMCMSLVGISSINLLQSFVNSSDEPTRDIIIKVCIHVLFIISSLSMAFIEYIHEKSKTFDKGNH